MNGPRWRTNRPIIEYMQGIIDFIGMVLRIVIYAFLLFATLRLLVFLVGKIL